VEEITAVVTFFSDCLEFKIFKSGFHFFAAAREMEFEMPSEMMTATEQSCRSGKRIEEM